jgi:hypothetical protein
MINYNHRSRRAYRKKTDVEKFFIAAKEMYNFSKYMMRLFRKIAPSLFKARRTHDKMTFKSWK